ncbi:hypothetical protein N656DRAFT_153896 [Canariomyces notabilis]|uniref:Uncharacterized protein n=1 Tax=Canariomyces notabilis TaxID=2074819 RepID=A0AAN6YPV8_9PEZI|nr:hypothetical protein N656DRAFT_153896 [Canariomyces arenarius]
MLPRNSDGPARALRPKRGKEVQGISRHQLANCKVCRSPPNRVRNPVVPVSQTEQPRETCLFLNCPKATLSSRHILSPSGRFPVAASVLTHGNGTCRSIAPSYLTYKVSTVLRGRDATRPRPFQASGVSVCQSPLQPPKYHPHARALCLLGADESS